MKYNLIRSEIKTGDIVLSSGNSFFSKLIKEATGIQWSHVSMAVWGKDLYRDSGDPDRLYVWESTSGGVGEVDFEKANYTPNVHFLSHIVNYGAGDVVVRHLEGVERTLPMIYGMQDYMSLYRGHSYEKDKWEILRAVPWVKAVPHLANNKQALETQFCWECVAGIYQAMGLLPLMPPANTYSNRDFAGDLPLLNGARLGAFNYIEF